MTPEGWAERLLPMAIIAALIGALAVVLGVSLAQRMVDRRNEVEKRRAVARTLKNQAMELVKMLQNAQSTRSERTQEVLRMTDTIDELEAACLHMPKSRREATYRILAELNALLVNLPDWVDSKGLLSADDEMSVARWTLFTAVSVSEETGVDMEEFQEQLQFYAANGPSGVRPGGPEFKVPARSRWAQFKSAMVGEG